MMYLSILSVTQEMRSFLWFDDQEEWTEEYVEVIYSGLI